MQRLAPAPSLAPRTSGIPGGGWLARRWYYTPKSRRAYSIRPVSPGDRRLLAEFIGVLEASTERDRHWLPALTSLLLERVIVGAAGAMACIALEHGAEGDRVIGVCASAPAGSDAAAGDSFSLAVADAYRGEQVGRTLLETLLRQARRAGPRQLSAEVSWSNRPMQALATSLGFQLLPLPHDRNQRLLVLELK